MKKELSVETLRERLDYDPGTGLFHRARGVKQNYMPGALAGTLHPKGYVHIILCGKEHMAHRLAWLHFYGSWPDGPIDHINLGQRWSH